MDNEESENEECCENCKHYEPSESIECKVLAKVHKWNRAELEIDAPDTFRCKGYCHG